MISELASLPDDLFKNMHSLTFLQLGVHLRLGKLPSFQGLSSLKTLTLALLMSLEELPSFSDLVSLERMSLVALSAVQTFPDLSRVQKLRSFIVSGSAEFCCNGFLGNKCDPTDQFCHPSFVRPPNSPFQCLASSNPTQELVTDATRSVFAQFTKTACFTFVQPAENSDDPISQTGLEQCAGVLYRQCQVAGNRTGMCYNTRFMPISCNGNALLIEMRRQQIRERVGERCDPQVEAWLGCVP